MNPRQEQLLSLVRQGGVKSIETLAAELGVTAQTVRRDVQRLSEAGAISRFHGGVRAAGSTTENMAYQHRETLNAEAKARIGRAVAAQIPNDCSLILTVGTTTYAVARALHEHKGLRIVTNDIAVGRLLAANRDCEVHLCGGIIRARDNAVVGEAAVEFIHQFRVDLAVIGVAGIETDGSLRDFDYREVKVTEAVIAHARQVWLVADASKFERRAMVQVAHLSQVHSLFTDAAPPAHFENMLAESKVHVEIAP